MNKEIDKPAIESAIRQILIAIGEDPDRPGLQETPKRVANMYDEIFKGLRTNPLDVVKVFDEEDNQEMVLVKDITVQSMCEHHLLPFIGVCHVAYIPKGGKVLGLSKIARIVDILSRKPQLQERLCNEIADVIMDATDALGAGVIMETEHLCITMRGIKKPGSKTMTYAFRGLMKDDKSYKLDLLTMIK